MNDITIEIQKRKILLFNIIQHPYFLLHLDITK